MKKIEKHEIGLINDQISPQNPSFQLLSEFYLSKNEEIDDRYIHPEIYYIDLDSHLITLNLDLPRNKRKVLLQFGDISVLYTSICKLPGNNIFCYGGKTFVPSGVTFIIDEFSNINILKEGFPCYFSSSIYYQSNIYVFGGVNQSNLNLCARYSLKSQKWFSLPSLPKAGKDFSIDSLGRFILYSSTHLELFIYDTYTNSHLNVLDIANKFNRLVICENSRGYVLQPNGDVFESEFNDVFYWNIVSNFEFPNTRPIGCKVKYKGCAYFIYGENLFKFDMAKLRGISVKKLENVIL